MRQLLDRVAGRLGYTRRSIGAIYRDGFDDGQLYERQLRTGYLVTRNEGMADVIVLPLARLERAAVQLASCGKLVDQAFSARAEEGRRAR
jgi:hypothetical protein